MATAFPFMTIWFIIKLALPGLLVSTWIQFITQLFYHNSVLIGEASTSIGAGLSLDAADTNNTFKNNIFANTQGGYAFTNYSTSYTSDYNNFYTSGTYLALQNGLYRNHFISLANSFRPGSEFIDL